MPTQPTIRAQLLIGFLSITALFVLLITLLILLFNGFSGSINDSSNVLVFNNQINQKLKLENYFILNDAVSSNFHKDKNSVTITQIEVINKNLFASLKKYPHSDKELSLIVDTIEKALIVHNKLFVELTDLYKIRGFRDYGLEGKMREYAHLLEEENNIIPMEQLLSLRRREKDYLMRNDLTYVKLFNSEVRELNQLFKHTGKLENLVLKNYAKSFNQLVEVAYKLSPDNASSVFNKFKKSAENLGALSQQFGNLQYQKEKSLVKTINLSYIGLIVLFIVFALVLSFKLAKKRSLPLEELTNKLQNVKSDELNSIQLQNESSISKELQQVIWAFNKLIRTLKQKFEELSKSNNEIATQNLELRKLNNELDSFVYSVSHDLRSPLASILGICELIKNEKDMQEIKDYNELILINVNKLDLFIRDILDLSRNVRKELEIEAIDLKALLNELFEQHKFGHNDHQIELRITENLNHLFFTDRNRLKIILNNLISNAIKYADNSKAKQWIKVDLKVNKREAEITIEDNGLGIQSAYLDKIFEMFFRAHEQSVGSGLGLYITAQVLEKLEGKIQVVSKVGIGTSFKLKIPNKTSTFREEKRVLINA